jgi:hypothetical protein
MSRKLTVLSIAALVIVGMLATAGVSFAQEPVEQAPCPMYEGGYGMSGGWRFGGTSSMLNVVAELLGKTPEELGAEVQSGKTLLEIAEDNDLTAEALADAMLATRVDAIQAAVEAGRITQEQADYMIENMQERMLSQIGSGDCLGLEGTGSRHGRGGRGGMMGGRGGSRMGGAFVDADGDGVCDLDGSQSGTFGGRWNTQPGQTL